MLVQSVDNMEIDTNEAEELHDAHKTSVQLIERLHGTTTRQHKGMKLLRRFTMNGCTYTCANSHIGNSVIQYYPSKGASTLEFGEIEHIIIVNGTTYLIIRHHIKLPGNVNDPFSSYVDFPGVMYSSGLMEPEAIELSQIRTHAARLLMADQNRAVLVPLSRY
jgi:hypothetical protein